VEDAQGKIVPLSEHDSRWMAPLVDVQSPPLLPPIVSNRSVRATGIGRATGQLPQPLSAKIPDAHDRKSCRTILGSFVGLKNAKSALRHSCENSLFFVENSLFTPNNSLLSCVGNFVVTH
jgi:hypothetical protein